tara:strand:+ start:275 stop:403 length:129 start_codon:yes stop_codon:yes gene_type:complete
MEEKLDVIINLLTEILDNIKVFSDFALEVSPQEAKEDIKNLK